MGAYRALPTRHSHDRRAERFVPHSIFEELCTSAASFHGHGSVRYRVVRHGNAFWIAPLRDGCVLTVYCVVGAGINAWAAGHLRNPDQTRHRLLNMAGHVTTEERITQELARLWLEA